MKDDVPNRRFLGPPRSAFDFGWMKRAAKKIDSLLNGQGDGIDITYGDSAVRYKASSGLSQWYYGEWSTTAATKGIKSQQVWTVSVGDTAGDYVCVKDDPGVTNPPDINNGFWHSIGDGDTIGVWV